MLRIILWLIVLYLAWQAYKVLRNTSFFEQEGRVKGDQNNQHIDIDENDIQDADFKDINQ